MDTLFGLKNNANVKLTYNLEKQEIVKTEGIDENQSFIEISNHFVFSMPMCIIVNNIPFFPTKYEILTKGNIIYASTIVPIERIKIKDDNFLNEHSKVKKNTIKFQDLILHNKRNRKRIPSQNQVMGESAKNHAELLIQSGKFSLESNQPISWHWCHLVAFSMLPTEKAQKKANLVCGTAACNGHMANIEAAVKRFIYEFKRPLGLEVIATYYAGTYVARRIRYLIYDKNGSRLSHKEYFNALTDIKTDVADYESIYYRMLESFK